ncbi:hypothetical protein [Phenylobacterium sp.]|uniref:hypothetical protein n=1 Tax=Phenylobacterium sp. TaxID=1871053 RepID=UPI002BCB39D7|nr:hypothetical protein [Phenylobacterium sp.]HVI33810.1 hypothetical protein [Phenylobacterium sp.]
MSLNVQPVTFFPVPPVRPVMLDRDEQAAKALEREQPKSAPRQLTGSAVGRFVDVRV